MFVFSWAARRLASAGVSPNTISLSSIIFAGLGGLCFAATAWFEPSLLMRTLWFVGGVLVLCRAMANLLDGMVAVDTRTASSTGELYNEIPDRVSDVLMLVGLGYAAGGSVLAGYLAAMGALMTAYVRAQGSASGAPQTYIGPMGKPHRNTLVMLIALWIAVTPQGWSVSWPAAAVTLWIIFAGCLITVWRRLRIITQSLRSLRHG